MDYIIIEHRNTFIGSNVFALLVFFFFLIKYSVTM